MAKKGFVSLIPKFENMQMEIGFTIEAHTDAEMPECMLGSTVLSRISDGTGPMITREMQEPVHEHQSWESIGDGGIYYGFVVKCYSKMTIEVLALITDWLFISNLEHTPM